MGRRLAVGANSFARKWFVPVDRANEFAPTKPLTAGFWIVHAVHAQLADGSIVKQLVSLLDRETYAGKTCWRLTDIVPNSIDWPAVPYCPIEDNRLERFRLAEGDIVIARTGATVGYAKRLHRRHPETVFASYLVRLRLKPDVDSIMVGVFVESDAYKSYVQSRIGGAAQPNANARVLAAAEILVPPRRVQRDFHDFVEPLVDEREVLQLQNQKLRAARDLLLPRLMTGEIAA